MGKFIRIQLYAVLCLMGACQVVPEYPVAPSISFGSVYFEDLPQSDVIYLTINFKDGDGDLGLSSADSKTPPFTDSIVVNGVKEANPNAYNIFPTLMRKVGDKYEIELPGAYNGVFPRLKEGETKGPIEGSLTYKITSFNFFNQDSSIVKIRVQIQDRALNKSNVVETPPFPVIYK